MESYELEKTVWTEHDFDIMGWHDCRLWAMAADTEAFEFSLDLDYIFQWVKPGPGEIHFKFWVCPVTMVFENVHKVTIDIESQQGIIDIDHLHKEEERTLDRGGLSEHLYRFECQEGEVSLRATGYKMYVRQPPRLIQEQHLDVRMRGGISIEKNYVAA
jgi:hypothetical protein